MCTAMCSYEPIIEEIEAGNVLEQDLTNQEIDALEKLYF